MKLCETDKECIQTIANFYRESATQTSPQLSEMDFLALQAYNKAGFERERCGGASIEYNRCIRDRQNYFDENVDRFIDAQLGIKGSDTRIIYEEAAKEFMRIAKKYRNSTDCCNQFLYDPQGNAGFVLGPYTLFQVIGVADPDYDYELLRMLHEVYGLMGRHLQTEAAAAKKAQEIKARRKGQATQSPGISCQGVAFGENIGTDRQCFGLTLFESDGYGRCAYKDKNGIPLCGR